MIYHCRLRDERTAWDKLRWAIKAQLPIQFQPPGAAGLSLARVTSFVHPIWVEPTITLLVAASLLSGIGVSLLVLAAFSYTQRRRRGVVTPLFFVLAVLSSLNLLALSAMHHIIALPRLRHALKTASCSEGNAWSTPTITNAVNYRFKGDNLDVVLPLERGLSNHQNAQFIFQLENITLALLEMVTLLRVHALFPDKSRVLKTARVLLFASGARFILSIGLQIPTSPQSPILPWREIAEQSRKLGEIFRLHAYASAYLPFITNLFATWSFIVKWRHLKDAKTRVGYCDASRKNDPIQRLRILICAGILLGLLQVSWHTYYTAISIRFKGAASIFPEWAYDYVLPRFLFHAGSALYPLATYVALHWNTPLEDVQCIDLVDIHDLGNDIPLDDLGTVPMGEADRIGNAPLIDFDTLGVDADA